MSRDTSPCFIISLLILGLVVTLAGVTLQAEARAFFVFGDSLVDNGNNNYLATTARADAPPYGVDYPTHRATGRFSNGLNIPDLISRVFFFFLSFFYQYCFFIGLRSYHVILLHSRLMSVLYITRWGNWLGTHIAILGSRAQGTKITCRSQLCLCWNWNSQWYWSSVCKSIFNFEFLMYPVISKKILYLFVTYFLFTS